MNEQELIKNIVGAIALPAQARAVEFVFDDDATGVPCARVNFRLAPGTRATERNVRALAAFKKKVARALLDDPAVTRWPYVGFASR